MSAAVYAPLKPSAAAALWGTHMQSRVYVQNWVLYPVHPLQQSDSRTFLEECHRQMHPYKIWVEPQYSNLLDCFKGPHFTK